MLAVTMIMPTGMEGLLSVNVYAKEVPASEFEDSSCEEVLSENTSIAVESEVDDSTSEDSTSEETDIEFSTDESLASEEYSTAIENEEVTLEEIGNFKIIDDELVLEIGINDANELITFSTLPIYASLEKFAGKYKGIAVILSYNNGNYQTMTIPKEFHNALVGVKGFPEAGYIHYNYQYESILLNKPINADRNFSLELLAEMSIVNGLNIFKLNNYKYPCESVDLTYISIPKLAGYFDRDDVIVFSEKNECYDNICTYDSMNNSITIKGADKLESGINYEIINKGICTSDIKLIKNKKYAVNDFISLYRNADKILNADLKFKDKIKWGTENIIPVENGNTDVIVTYFDGGKRYIDIVNCLIEEWKVDSFEFYDEVIEENLNKEFVDGKWTGNYIPVEINPFVKVKPEGAVDYRNREEVSWELLTGETAAEPDAYEIVSRENTYDRLLIKKPGIYTFRITLNNVFDEDGNNFFSEQTINVIKQFDESDITDDNFPRAYAVNGYDTKLSDIKLLVPDEYIIEGEGGYASSYVKEGKNFVSSKTVTLPKEKEEDPTVTETYSYAWKYPNTSLLLYKGVSDYNFPVVVTKTTITKASDNSIISTFVDSATISVNVVFTTINGIKIAGAHYDNEANEYFYGPYNNCPQYVAPGDFIQYELQGFDISNIRRYYSEELDSEVYSIPDEYDYITSKLPAYFIGWSVSQSKAVRSAVDNKTETKYGIDGLRIAYDDALIGKKNIVTCSIIDSVTKKKVFFKDSITTYVNKKPITNFDDIERNEWLAYDPDTQELWIAQEKNSYNKLTVTSLDPSVITLGRAEVYDSVRPRNLPEGGTENVDVVVTKLPYTQKSIGSCNIKIVAADELKSTYIWKLELEADNKPVIINDVISVKTNRNDGSYIDFLVNKNNIVNEDYKDNIVVSGKDKDCFVFSDYYVDDELINDAFYYGSVKLICSSKAVKNKTYKLSLDITTADGKTNSYPITVKTYEKKTDLSIKQTEKVNLFYNDSEGNGRLIISGEDWINIEDTSVKLNECDYELKMVNNGAEYLEFRICLKEGATGLDKAGNITFNFKFGDFVDKDFSQKITVATEKKAPQIILSSKSDTLYPSVGFTDSAVYLTKGSDNMPLDLRGGSVVFVKSKTDRTSVNIMDAASYDENDLVEVNGGKNLYSAGYFYKCAEEKMEDAYFFFDAVNGTDIKNGKDNFKLEVKAANWNEPVTVNYSIVVTNNQPKLKLSKNIIGFNKNNTVYREQEDFINVWLDSCNRPYFDLNECRTYFTGDNDKASSELKKGNLSISFDEDGRIRLRLVDTDIAVGSYKYNLNVEYKIGDNIKILKIPFTVKITDTDPVQKNITVKQSGSIDVLNRDNTYISIKPTVKNMVGTIDHIYLENSDDRYLFDGRYDGETGELKIYANNWSRLATNVTYKLTPVYCIRTSKIVGKPITFKVKQSAVKINTLYSETNFYGTLNNNCYNGICATINKSNNVDIERIEQVDNYNVISQGEIFTYEDRIVELESIYHRNNNVIKKKGETITVTYYIYLKDAAVNSKPIKYMIKYKIAKL